MSRGTNRKHDGKPEPNRGMTRRSILATREKCGVIDRDGRPCPNVLRQHGFFCVRHWNLIVKSNPEIMRSLTGMREGRERILDALRRRYTTPQTKSHWSYEGREDELIAEAAS
jgi:hypothetical protein